LCSRWRTGLVVLRRLTVVRRYPTSDKGRRSHRQVHSNRKRRSRDSDAPSASSVARLSVMSEAFDEDRRNIARAAIGAFLGTDAEVKGCLWAVPAVRPTPHFWPRRRRRRRSSAGEPRQRRGHRREPIRGDWMVVPITTYTFVLNYSSDHTEQFRESPPYILKVLVGAGN
jgi:hypothetical protein